MLIEELDAKEEEPVLAPSISDTDSSQHSRQRRWFSSPSFSSSSQKIKWGHAQKSSIAISLTILCTARARDPQHELLNIENALEVVRAS